MGKRVMAAPGCSRQVALKGLGSVLSVLLLALLLWTHPIWAEQRHLAVTGVDFVEHTQSIFVGKVVDRQSYFSEDNRFILTRYVFAVEDTIKGPSQDRLEIVEYGGTVGGESMSFSHAPRYALGQDYLVFSYRDRLRQNRTFSGPLGRLPVVLDPEKKRVARIYPSHPLFQVLEQPLPTTFSDLQTLSRQLGQAVQERSHEAN